jgi:hypothetical protein
LGKRLVPKTERSKDGSEIKMEFPLPKRVSAELLRMEPLQVAVSFDVNKDPEHVLFLVSLRRGGEKPKNMLVEMDTDARSIYA